MDKLDLILEKVTSIDAKVDSLEHRMDSLECRMDSMERRMDSMENDIKVMKADIDVMKADIAETKESILKINVRLDEDISRAIRFIADGHFDLERKFDRAHLDEKTKEYLHTKILCHDAEINQIKLRCAKCA